jgi:hypothetical protein
MNERLWNEYFVQSPQDVSAGIMYCLRYKGDRQRVREHQLAVIDALTSMGVQPTELKDKPIGFMFNHIPSLSEKRRANSLLEELDCLNTALVYLAQGINCTSLGSLKNELIEAHNNLLKLPFREVYNSFIAGMEKLVADLSDAKEKNLLSRNEKRELSELEELTDQIELEQRIRMAYSN